MKNHTVAALKLSADLVVTLDEEGRILTAQDYRKALPQEDPQPHGDLTGLLWQDLFCPTSPGWEAEKAGVRTDQPGRMPEPGRSRLTKTLDGRYFEWRFVPISDSKGASLLGAARDVSDWVRQNRQLARKLRSLTSENAKRETRRRELERQLEHADRLATVGQLAAGIAHELNGPLNNILGYAQLAAKQPDLPEQVYTDLDHIVRFSLHTRQIVKKVMLFSRQTPPKMEAVSLNTVIQDSLYFTEPLCTKTGVRIVCRLAEGLADLTADSSQLHQVMVNLIVNAVQAMPKTGGQITITTGAASDTELFMAVADTGEGMNPDTLNHCFLPFYTTKDVDMGTGLGLSVVHGIVTSHGGTITADSTQGEGSCFTIILPITVSQGDAHA